MSIDVSIIETERLIIRPWQENDAVELYEMCLDPEITHCGLSSYSSVEESLNVIRQQQETNEILAIVHKDSKQLIGYIGLSDMNRYSGYKELNYVISSEYRNQGYATEALKRMLAYAFDELNLSVVSAWVRSHNIKCVRVLEKCGFAYEGTLRKHARDKSDTLCYSILKEDWRLDIT